MKIDLTVAAIPAFIGAMVAEHAWQRAHPVEPGTRAGDYQLADTVASLSMGLGSLAAPYVARRLLDPVTPGVGRHGRTLLAVGAAAAVLTTVGDVVRRRVRDGSLPEPQTVPAAVRAVQDELADIRLGPALPREERPAIAPVLRRTHGALAVSAVASTALVTSTTWAAMTAGKRLFARSPLDLGTGPWAAVAAVLGWDFIYYWNHRASHESRWLWAVHVVHHSSERYNLSTALRQPVAEGVTLTVPYGLLALAGVRPALIEQARGINLIYQFWIHTEAIQRLGWVEKVFNTPSHHRVHHGSNRDYLDRNHGSILILWDRLFGTFEEEDEPVVYGLTSNVDSYNPARIATHEWADIAADVAAADDWHDRFSFLLRRPGWAYARRPAAGVA
ncbi:sterol desaturase family protein [Nocardioides baculatus]|uniref:Sterol desaturase family protein n=1 Tax=Nocardioides baculatus TaxID=2801337 RepID=A0ABS1L400_9ACTN|nr:sterol desaturase family protein [Nocardioides baculatus]MBL0746418.1 sterol desaturase family protein [Nocardioides baculatus]